MKPRTKMITESNFADHINNFIAQKKALGYLYDTAFHRLYNFANYVKEHYPDATVLTKEIAFEWCLRQDGEHVRTVSYRIILMRELAKYLISIGEEAFIIPTEVLPKTLVKPTHIFTMEELNLFFAKADTSIYTEHRLNSIVAPAVFRILYCCGLRPTEPLKLRTEDVNLNDGTVDILESKGHKSRTIVLPDDLSDYLKDYHKKISNLIPDRKAFFPNINGDHHNYHYLWEWFKQIRACPDVFGRSQIKPQLYDFRHSFATHRLYLWMNEGKDINTMLPYLSTYMGHADLPSTYYYIHFVPGLFENLAGEQYTENPNLLPEVVTL